VAAVVAHKEVLVAVGIEHRMVLAAGHKVASVAVVAHREEFAVGRDNFEMEVVLHTGWVVVTALQAPSHSLCKIADQR
jgi:hypothetical protein